MERQKITREFKLEAVKLIKDRGVSYAQAEQEVSVHQSQLPSWVKAFAPTSETFGAERTAWWRTRSLANPSPLPNSLLTGKRTESLSNPPALFNFESRHASKLKGLQLNSLRNEKGNILAEQGILVQEQGISPIKSQIISG